MRLLLKILAISDVVIYRTRAERLSTDIFKFLADASEAYLKHFSKELKNASNKLKLDISTISPYIVIFHETNHTDILKDDNLKTVEMQLNERFTKAKLTCDAFRSIEYVGTKTNIGTDFTNFKNKMNELLKNNAVRTPRKISVIYQVLKVLNDKFNGTISATQLSSFPDEYFTCSQTCLACGIRCKNSINHTKDNLYHENSGNCKYVHQYDNKVYVCIKCYENREETIVIPKTTANNENALVGIFNYAMSGYVLECPRHGILYRSRQHWYGNSTPELSGVIRSEIKHVWPGQDNFVGTSPNAARKILDNVNFIGNIIQTVSAPTAKYAKQWMIDRIAPSYWTPDSKIVACFKCNKYFEESERKHHCRGCGQGFCDQCSTKRKVIDWWSPTEPQRVCDDCFNKNKIKEPVPDVTARKVCETVTGTIDILSYATKIPLDYLKDSARPTYWKPDSECVKCELCKQAFNELLPLHHCRNCGNGVCSDCSPHLKPVPSRGWEQPVRVCKACYGDIDLDDLIQIKE
jgi:zinc finger FYVE domain-containing protein 1